MSQQDFVPESDGPFGSSGHGHSQEANADLGSSANGAHDSASNGALDGSYHSDSMSGSGTNGSVKSNGALATIENRVATLPTLNTWYGPPPRPDILSAKPNPVELLHATRRRWPLAIGLGLAVSFLAAGLLWFFMPVKYEAFALVKVSGANPKVMGVSNTAIEEFGIFKRTQANLILSGAVLNGTLRDPEIARLPTILENNDDPLSFLKANVSIDYPDDSEVMRIAMKGKRKEDLKKIVNMVLKKYMSEVVQREKDLKLDQETKLDKTYVQLFGEYEAALKSLHTLQNLEHHSGSHSVQTDIKLAFEDLTDLLAQRNKLADRISENSMAIVMQNARKANPEANRPSDAVIEMELSKDPIILQFSQHLAQLNQAFNAERNKSTTGSLSSKAKKYQKDIVALQEELENRRADLKPKLIESQMAAVPFGHMSLADLESQQKILEEKYTEQNKRISAQADVLKGLENYSSKVTAKQEELLTTQRSLNELRAELNHVKVERLAPDRVMKLDDAELTNGNGDAMRKYVAVAFTWFLSFFGIVLSVAFLEFQSRKINSVREVKDGLGINVVGELPNISGRTWKRIKGGKGHTVLKALMAERIDGTRTAMIHSSAAEPPRVVMVTSAESGEGKTTTASQLAASLARSGRRTLLIDADVRNPGAHRVFDLLLEPGLCELLRGEAEREAVIHPTRTANLWLLPAGRCDLRSVQALSTSYLGTTIAALCVQFDYVIIDAGPVLKIADPLLIGQHVDAAILSVMRDVSKIPKVYEASERLRSVGITVLGSVVNGVNDDAARHGVELLMAETAHHPVQGQTASTT